MTELMINNSAAVVPASDLQPVMFDDFVRFIDRGEKTTRTYLNNLRQFAAWMQLEGITRPTRADILLYRQYLEDEHDAIQLDPNSPTGWSYRTNGSGQRYTVKCKPNTIAQYLRSVCQFFSWTAASGIYPNIAANIHAPKIRHDAHKKDALTAADVLTIEKDIINNASDRTATAADAKKDSKGKMDRASEQGKRLFAMYLLAVNAGLRTVEISRANIKDIEVRNGNAVLYVWGKGHTEPDARKPLAPEVNNAVKEYINSRSDKPTASSPLFVSTGNRSGGKRIATTTISTMLKKAMQHAGYNSERLTAHSLRHTCGTVAMDITGDLYATQKYMRHSNPATTEIYLHNDTERRESETAQKIYDCYHGVTSQGNDLAAILKRMTPAQLAQLKAIAAAMA